MKKVFLFFFFPQHRAFWSMQNDVCLICHSSRLAHNHHHLRKEVFLLFYPKNSVQFCLPSCLAAILADGTCFSCIFKEHVGLWRGAREEV